MHFLIAGFVGMFVLFAVWFKDKRQKIPMKLSTRQITWFVVAAVVSLILIIIGAIQISRNEVQKNDVPVSTIPVSNKAKIDDNSPLQYKVVDQKKSGESLRVTVITPETSDARIIAINDKVYAEFKDKSKSLFIDYFDDEEISKIYFTKITDKKTSDKDKKNLLSHYIALMTANEISGKKLNKITANNSLLKTY